VLDFDSSTSDITVEPISLRILVGLIGNHGRVRLPIIFAIMLYKGKLCYMIKVAERGTVVLVEH
jgi:hypothetical protein